MIHLCAMQCTLCKIMSEIYYAGKHKQYLSHQPYDFDVLKCANILLRIYYEPNSLNVPI